MVAKLDRPVRGMIFSKFKALLIIDILSKSALLIALLSRQSSCIIII